MTSTTITFTHKRRRHLDEVKCRVQDVPHIVRWYAAFHCGENYAVQINGRPVRPDRDGHLVKEVR